MASNIKVNIDVASGEVDIAANRALTLTEQVRILRKELQKIPEGTKEWTLLQAKFNETKDNLDRVNVKSKELFGTFSSLPGAIGQVSGQLDSTVGILKTFSAIKFSDIKTQFNELGKDLGNVAKNIAQLTGLTTVYTVVTNASAKALQFFGVSAETAGIAAKGLGLAISTALAVTGILAITAAVQLLGDAWDYFSKKAERAEEAEKKRAESFQKGNKAALDAESAQIKRQGDLYVAQAKAKGASDEEIFKLEQQNRRLLIASQQRYYDSIEKKDSDEARSALSALKDSQVGYQTAIANHQADIFKKTKDANDQLSKENKAKRDKELEEVKKNNIAASEAMLEGRAKELKVVDDKYSAQIALAKKYGKDVTQLEAAQKQERKTINTKYDDDEAKTAAEFAKKLGAIHIAAIVNDVQQKKAEREEKYNEDLRNLEKDKEFIKLSEDAKNVYRQELRAAADQDQTALDDKASQDIHDRKLKALQLENEGLIKGTQSYFDNKRAIINESEANEINDARVAMDQKLITEEEFEKAKADIQAKYTQQRKDLAKSELDTYLGYASSVLGAISGIFGQASSVLKMQQDQDLQNAAGNAEEIDKLKRKHFEENKKMQIAQAIIGTLQSAVQAFQSLAVIPVVGPALGAAAAAAALIFGYKQVALIRAQTYQSDSSSASAASTSVGSTSGAPAAFSVPSIGAPQIGATSAQEGTIAGIAAGSMAANNSSNRPLRAYVVGNDITSEQQLQRRIRAAARLGG